ncbi:patatin-like phospholipase family protein [Zeimonas arvi]|uniref:Patatin n=1 Tax=Zeimonas arvi TaxID=2498847 RepID=A0A5C8P3Z5_9BURK|nr:patatin-like phospholipase family protein [Zeimonas arvi]TXL68371.1 patatin [Zeimonas arvi]
MSSPERKRPSAPKAPPHESGEPASGGLAARFAGKRVGLALGSGSARGLAHIGVLRALVEAGIRVDVVAGTSMGAFVGAMFAAGKLDELEKEFRGMGWQGIASLVDPVFPRSGLIDGLKIGEFVRRHVAEPDIEALPIPFRAVATDISTGEEVAIGSGSLIEAVRASIAVPGVFNPVRCNGKVFVDGGLVDPVPVSVARQMGAEVVIAVDLNHDIVTNRLTRPNGTDNGKPIVQAMTRVLESFQPLEHPMLIQFREWLEREPLPGIVDVMLASLYIMQARIAQATLQLDRPEVLIQPPLGSVRFLEFDQAGDIIEIGYRSATGRLHELAGEQAPGKLEA